MLVHFGGVIRLMGRLWNSPTEFYINLRDRDVLERLLMTGSVTTGVYVHSRTVVIVQ